ncbi:hypothetical protein EIP86_008786 [Pleurotus ostreatoroseus]|nr:hypothetical protein EIP86_008786 [Pleurotus ostreatoroseus]
MTFLKAKSTDEAQDVVRNAKTSYTRTVHTLELVMKLVEYDGDDRIPWQEASDFIDLHQNLLANSTATVKELLSYFAQPSSAGLKKAIMFRVQRTLRKRHIQQLVRATARYEELTITLYGDAKVD